MSWHALVWLDPARVQLALDLLGLTLESGGVRHEGLIPVAAFPTSAPAVVALRDLGGATIAMIEDLARLPPASRDALRAALALQVFSPVVLAVLALTYDDSAYHWSVDTSAGPRTFRTRQTWSELPVTTSATGELTVLADDGVRYRIPDPARMDERSRRLLFPVI